MMTEKMRTYVIPRRMFFLLAKEDDGGVDDHDHDDDVNVDDDLCYSRGEGTLARTVRPPYTLPAPRRSPFESRITNH